MIVAEINMCENGSTGRIMLQLAEVARLRGILAATYSTHLFSVKYRKLPQAPMGHEYYGSFLDNGLHYILHLLTGLNGCFSYLGTLQLIRKLKKLRPDIIHLHNLHGCCFCFPAFMRYAKRYRIPLVWTLHDCWAFTGGCPHFAMIGCEKWKTGCHHCPQYKAYPKSYVDQSKLMFTLKKKWFTGLDDLTLVTPSQWLADLVKQSFLKAYPVRVIHNGIDLSVFKQITGNFKDKHLIPQGKHIVLGVSLSWSNRKGLDVFIELSRRLDSEKYQIVLVGIGKELAHGLPDNIISIDHTQNQAELAEIYSTSDVFVNPTREDTFPTVNLEALACGTPVVTFQTGGSPECIDPSSGSVVAYDDIDALLAEIIHVCGDKPYSSASCVERASRFDKNQKHQEYMAVYKNLLR